MRQGLSLRLLAPTFPTDTLCCSPPRSLSLHIHGSQTIRERGNAIGGHQKRIRPITFSAYPLVRKNVRSVARRKWGRGGEYKEESGASRRLSWRPGQKDVAHLSRVGNGNVCLA